MTLGLTPGMATAWQSLVDDLDGDRAAVAGFAGSWAGLLPHRTGMLAQALQHADADGARDVLLTLTCTADMLGVDRLADAASRGLDALEEEGVDGAQRHVEPITNEARTAAILVAGALAQESWSNR
jgi:cobalamin biosynthesis protein CobD/CbiB